MKCDNRTASSPRSGGDEGSKRRRTRVVSRPNAIGMAVAALAGAIYMAGASAAPTFVWKTVVNNGDLVPTTTDKTFNSCNQPPTGRRAGQLVRTFEANNHLGLQSLMLLQAGAASGLTSVSHRRSSARLRGIGLPCRRRLHPGGRSGERAWWRRLAGWAASCPLAAAQAGFTCGWRACAC